MYHYMSVHGFWSSRSTYDLVLFKIYFGFGPTAYWPCNLITLIGKTYFYCVQWYWPFWKRMGGFWRRIRKINIDIWIWNQVCGSEKLRTAKETFLSQNSIVLLYKTWWFDIFIIKTFRYVTLISFSLLTCQKVSIRSDYLKSRHDTWPSSF